MLTTATRATTVESSPLRGSATARYGGADRGAVRVRIFPLIAERGPIRVLITGRGGGL